MTEMYQKTSYITQSITMTILFGIETVNGECVDIYISVFRPVYVNVDHHLR